MEELKKMVLSVANSVSTLSQNIESLRTEMKTGFKNTDNKIDILDEKLTKRIDKMGLQIARLEDDAPTVEEFDNLEKRVSKVEHQIASL